MTPCRRAAALLAIPLLLAGCQTNQAIYERPLIENDLLAKAPAQAAHIDSYPYDISNLMPSYRPELTSDEAGLWMTVEKAEQKSKTAGTRVTDKQLNNYIHSVACRLAGKYCGDIRVYVMRIPHFNATMYPNGMMHVWTGLLLRVQNEAQLAAVLGHEIGHYLRRHSLQRYRSIIEQTNGLVVVQLLTAVAGVPAVGDLMALAAAGGAAAFSRDHEREADGYGLLLLSKAGYDPTEAAKVWKRVIRETEADKKYSSPSLFSASHPQSEERMAVLADLAGRVATSPRPETGRDRFEAIMGPLRATYLRDEIHQRNFDKTEALLDILLEDGGNLSELHFFKGELYRLRKAEGDLEKALKEYLLSISEGSAPAEIYRSLGLVQRKMGRTEDALDSLRRYITANPRAEDFDMIKQLIERSSS